MAHCWDRTRWSVGLFDVTWNIKQVSVLMRYELHTDPLEAFYDNEFYLAKHFSPLIFYNFPLQIFCLRKAVRVCYRIPLERTFREQKFAP